MARNRRPRIYDQEHSAREGEPLAVQVIATDRNPGDTLTYRIVSGNSQGLFQIDSQTGIISRADGGAFDFETDAHRYDLRVRVTDDGHPPKSRTADVTIRITDTNDSPHEIALSNLSLDENAAGATVGIVTVADQDDDIHSLAVDDARFEIVGGALKLKDGVSLDHEAGDPVTVTITATDDEGGSLSQEFAVTLNDLNEAPTGIALSSASVDENAAGAVVGAVTIADPDDPAEPFGAHTLTVDDARFEIADGLLKLVDGVALDHETEGTVSVTVSATDGGGLVTSQIFTIVVDDVNEAPTAIGLSRVSVDENVAGAVVGAVLVTDPDDPAQPFGGHTLTVDDARFEIAGDMLKLVDGVTLDHEATGTVAVTVTATDGGGASVNQVFDIVVTDVNEAPTAISLSNASVDEVIRGGIVGTLSVSDPDDPSSGFGAHSFTVDDSRFEVDGGMLKLKPGIALDHEVADSVTVTVTAIDGGGASLSQAFDIVVNDLNDVPALPIRSFTVWEDAGIGAVVGTVVGIDPDDPAEPFGTLTYSLTDDAGGRFAIDAATGRITTTATLDHETAASHTVIARVTDGAGAVAGRPYTINVADVNEASTGVSLGRLPALVPDDTPGVFIGRLTVDDPDAPWEPFGTNTLSIDDARFEIVNSFFDWQYLKLKDGVALDFGSEPTVTLTFTATDVAGMETTHTLDLEVLDVVAGRTFFQLQSLDGDNGTRFFSSRPGDILIGDTINSAGDLNGDGYADMVIGVPNAYDIVNPIGGAVYVAFGGPNGLPADFDLTLLDGTNGFRLTGTPVFDGAGAQLSALGDINGDGLDDLLVTAVQTAASAGSGTGEPVEPIPANFVVFGSASGWAPDIDLSTLNGIDGFRIEAGTESGLYGYSAAAAGDVNGDGLADLILGDPYGSPDGQQEGTSYVVYGKSSGWTEIFDPSNLGATEGFRIDGAAPGDFSGFVADGGDINGDGFDDLVIGVPEFGYDYGGSPSESGSVYVVYGGPSDQIQNINLGSIDGTNGFRISGFPQYGEFFSISAEGDINGDGFADLAISAPDSNYPDGGAYVIYGGAAGVPANVDVSTLDGSNGFRIGSTGIDGVGTAISIVGDVDGDGVDDLLVGTRGSTDVLPPGSPGFQAGSAFLVFGQEGGFSASFDLTRIDGLNGIRLDGSIPYGFAGSDVAGAGDVDGDGLDDFLISARNASPHDGAAGYGETYLLYGDNFAFSVTEMGTSASDMLSGTADADSLVGAQGDDVLVGNGGADVLYGGAGNDVMAVGDLAFARIDGGSGTDTLRLDGAGQSLDLTALGNTAIQGIERIDLTGSGDNAVTLAVTDLLTLSDEGNDLFVAGDAGDQVTLSGDWRFDGSSVVDGVTYNSFSVDGVQAAIYVEDDVVVPGSPETMIALSNAAVDESVDGAVVGTLTVTETGDPAADHGFAVDDARFEVVDGVLKLKPGQSLDHESQDMVTVTVTTTNGFSVSQSFDIAVADVNEAPDAISLSDVTVVENAAGAVIGTVTVADPDDPSIPFGAHGITVDDGRFEVVNGLLKLRDNMFLDHEAQESIPVILTATDGGGASVSRTFDISVADANETPTSIALSAQAVDEATAGAVVGTVLVTDPDDPSGAFGMHDITVSDARFEVVDGLLKLKDGVALDFAAGSTVSVVITATDGGGLGVSHSQTITVNEIDEAPTVSISAVVDTIAEEDAGARIGQVVSADPDRFEGSTAPLTISVDDTRFEVDYFGQLKLRDDAAIDFETEPTVTVTVTATDATGLSGSQSVTVTVRDVVDGMTFISLEALDGGNGTRLISSDRYDGNIGWSVSAVGDVNGDGYADIIVGVPLATAGPEAVQEGASYVVFGSADGYPADLDMSALDGTDGFRIDGTDTDYVGLGAAVSGAGDFNGDGFADILVSATAFAAPKGTGWPPLPINNESFVIFGKADGWASSIDLEAIGPADGIRLVSSLASDSFGYQIAGLGDFNGDGFADIAIGDINAKVSGEYSTEGASYVLFGTAEGLPADLDLATLDGGNGFRIDGAVDDYSGFVQEAGDLNGDGYDDLAIGVQGSYNPITGEPSSIQVLFGGAGPRAPVSDLGLLDPADGFRITGLESGFESFALDSAGDVNGDGLDDLIIGTADGPDGWNEAYVVYGSEAGFPVTFDVSTIDGSNGFRIGGPGIGAFAGNVAGAGDVNGDGIDDLMIAGGGLNLAGAVYVMYGRDGGFADGLDVSLIDGTNGFRLDGTVPHSGAGFTMGSAGDANGDGFADLIVGAPFEGAENSSYGQAYLFYGGDFTGTVGGLGTVGSDTLIGTASDDSLIAAQGDDVLVGNGGADVLYGGAGDDVLAAGDPTFARIDGGGGTDTLRLDGAGQSLDLTAIGNTVIDGVERIDLTGSGDNALNLAIADLLTLSDESNDLFVAGDAGDQVTLSGDWRFDGLSMVDGVTYNTFSVDGVQAALYVEDDVVVPGSAAVSVALSNLSVDENADGAAIGALTVSESGTPVPGYGFAVSDARFEVVDGVLKLKPGQTLDHEAQDTVQVTVTTTNGFSVSQAFDIAVADVNEAPGPIQYFGVQIVEESAGQSVGVAYSVDLDDGASGAVTFTVDDPRFEFVDQIGNNGTLKLKDGQSLDYETEPSVTLTLTGTDGGGLSVSETVTLQVYDIVEREGVISLSSLDGDNGARLFANVLQNANFGTTVTNLGDINGDGYDDIAVGAEGVDVFGRATPGPSYVLFGSPDGGAERDLNLLNGEDAFGVSGVSIGGLGASVRTAGDVNGDGLADLFVSVPSSSGGQSVENFVVFGKETGWAADLDLQALDGTDGFRVFSPDASDDLGSSVGVGDINGDGFDDLIIGDPGSPLAYSGPGVGYVVFGKAGGWVADVDLAALDGTDGFRLDPGGSGTTGFFGSAGDINGDGFEDFVVGSLESSPYGFPYNSSDLATQIVFGAADGWTPIVEPGAPDGPGGFRVVGVASTGLSDSAQLDSFAMRSAGDINGDGVEDLVFDLSTSVGSPAAYVLFGQDRDWPQEFHVSSSLDAGFFVIADGVDFLGLSVSAAGDINGDGLDDLLVGGLSTHDGVNSFESYLAGGAYVVFGQQGGYGGLVDLLQMDANTGLRIDGGVPSGFAGSSVSAAGDVNGDGFDDLLISAPEAFVFPREGVGEAYILYGDDFNGAVTATGTAADDLLTGTVGADSLIGAQGNDILVGDGGADVLYGGAGDDVLAVGDGSFARIDGGSGTDTLRLDGAGQTLDLDMIGDMTIDGIERIDLTGTGDNSASLAITDLLQLSDESNDLFVAGDTGDQVTVVGDWQNTGPTTVDGTTYDAYSVAGVDATLYVEDDVTVTAVVTGI